MTKETNEGYPKFFNFYILSRSLDRKLLEKLEAMMHRIRYGTGALKDGKSEQQTSLRGRYSLSLPPSYLGESRESPTALGLIYSHRIIVFE